MPPVFDIIEHTISKVKNYPFLIIFFLYVFLAPMSQSNANPALRVILPVMNIEIARYEYRNLLDLCLTGL